MLNTYFLAKIVARFTILTALLEYLIQEIYNSTK